MLEAEVSERNNVIEPSDYLALRDFLRGYLNQDAVAIHGTAIRAAHAFRKDADRRETAIVHTELQRLLAETNTLPDSELAEVLESLGNAWRFRSRLEVEQLCDALT